MANWHLFGFPHTTTVAVTIPPTRLDGVLHLLDGKANVREESSSERPRQTSKKPDLPS